MKLLKRKGFKRKLFNSCDFFFKIQWIVENCFGIIWCKLFKDLLEKILIYANFYEVYSEAGKGKEEQGRRGFLNCC